MKACGKVGMRIHVHACSMCIQELMSSWCTPFGTDYSAVPWCTVL